MLDALTSATNAGVMAANSLIRTETNYVTGQAELQAYADAGIAQYRYEAVFDGRTCDKCQPLHGKVFAVSEQQVGVNFHPMHPWCRYSESPVLAWDTGDGKRWSRTIATGEQEHIPRDMGFAEWKEWQKDGCPDIAKWMLQNAEKPAILNYSTQDGVMVTAYSSHAMDRIIKRIVQEEEILDALQHPLSICSDKTDDAGRVSRRYIGKDATVNVNTSAGIVTTVWKTGKKTRKKMEEEK